MSEMESLHDRIMWEDSEQTRLLRERAIWWGPVCKEVPVTPLIELLLHDVSFEEVENVLEEHPDYAEHPEMSASVHVALALKRYDIAEVLVKNGLEIDVNALDDHGLSLLMKFVINEDIDGVKFCISHGGDVNCSFLDSDEHENDRINLLEMVVFLENLELVEMLLDNGAEIVYKDPPFVLLLMLCQYRVLETNGLQFWKH